MTNVIREVPVVSEKLAKDFEHVANAMAKVNALNISNYAPVADYGFRTISKMVETLARMYVLGYKVEKNKRYVFKLPKVTNRENNLALIKTAIGNKFFELDDGCDFNTHFKYSNGFTKFEIEENKNLKQLSKGCELVEVEDQ